MKNIAIAAGLILSGLYSREAAATYTVTCESTSGQTRNCPLYNGGTPYLETQLSRAGCYQGQTWGHYDNSIWVSNGCRATFTVYPNGSHGGNGNSSSSNGKALAATAAVVLGAAAIAAMANKNNEHGSYNNDYYGNDGYHGNNNYGYNNHYQGNNGGYYGGYSNRSVTCESEGRDRRRCPVGIGRAHVEVSRQLSKADCRFGYNWNYDKNGIYVWDGCRAVFSVY